MFKGIQTGIYIVDDMKKAKDWYSKFLGIHPILIKIFMQDTRLVINMNWV